MNKGSDVLTGRFSQGKQMKRQAILLGIALALTPVALAQLPGGLGDGPIIRGIEGTIDRTVDRSMPGSLNDGLQRASEKLMQANDPQLEAKKAEFDEWHKGMAGKVAELLAKAKEFEDQIYAANQPMPHKYEVVPAQ